ncbi:MAG: CXXX repeat peptide maturase [Sporomusaceae bacterium]|nr:CXXX repeat peptide maturase [Sporomusaceae bacterium]
MLTHLLVLVDGSAPSFCHYDHDRRQTALMPLATLERAIAFAASRRLSLTMLPGREELPPEYRAVLAKTDHAAIVPAALADRYPNAVLVLDPDDTGGAPGDAKRRFILRLPRRRLTAMADLVRSCLGRASRLDVYLGDIDRYTAADIEEYGRQLDLAAGYVAEVYRQGSLPEVNIFSDRMLLSGMNNCDAGTVHLTVAPNGNFYICPGFYYDDESNAAGSLEAGVALVNSQLLTLANAPVCSCCDAYHCKRCVHLNARTTLEWNTPSREQCVLAHLERNAARLIRERLGTVPPFSRLRAIPAVDYFDPFEQLPTRRL